MNRVALCPTLIGREEELRAALGALQAASSGAGTSLFLLGEAGIGKSRLGREVAEEARRRGMAVLVGRAVQGGTPVPFRPLTQALLSHLRVAGRPEAPELEPFLPSLGRLVPEWRREAAAGETDSIVILGEALLRLLRVVGEGRGCLLLLEDLHWADPDTLAVLEYLADNLDSEPIVCLATVRTGEASEGLRLAHQLRARRTGLVIELHSLSDSDVERMARDCLGAERVSADVVDTLSAYAEGVPFLVEELLAVLPDAGAAPGNPPVPITFAETVTERLLRFHESAQQVLHAAAVLGRYFDWTLLPEIADLPEAEVLKALQDAVNAQLVAVEAGPGQSTFRFRHALTRDAVLADLLPPHRAALAERALAAVLANHQDLPDPWCELAAELAEAAGEEQEASRLLLEAGRRALRRGALATAEAALRRARELGDPGMSTAADELLVEALALAGKTDAVTEAGERLLAELTATTCSNERRAWVHLLLARAAATATRLPEAEHHLQLARVLAVDESGERLRPQIAALAAYVAIGDNRPEEAAALAREALTAAERMGMPETACEALEVLGRCARLHSLTEAEAAFERARVMAEEHGLTVWRIRALLELGTIDLLSGAPLDRLYRTLELALTSGALATAAVVELQIAGALVSRFDLEAAHRSAVRVAEAARRFHLDPVQGIALTLVAAAVFPLGRDTEADQALDDATAAAGRYPDVTGCALGIRGEMALWHERRDSARRDLDAAMEAVRRAPAASAHPFRGLWALLHAAEDREAEQAIEGVRSSGVTVARWNRGFLRCAEAVVLGRGGHTAQAEAAFAQGQSDLAITPWYRHLAARLVAEPAIVEGWGDPAAWLREAVTFLEGVGNERALAACRSLLRKAGAPVPRKGRGEAAVPPELQKLGVTSREMDVLLLLAEGLSNREVGERLFLSPRTVERHVENLAGKVGVHGRSQLVAFAARLPSVP